MELGWCLTSVFNWRNSALLPLPAILTLGHLLQELVTDLVRDFSAVKCFQTENIPAKESLCFGMVCPAKKKKQPGFFHQEDSRGSQRGTLGHDFLKD